MLDAIYTDPWYGLNNPYNYYHWQVLEMQNTNTTQIYKRLAWKAEMRSYWNLTAAQMQTIQTNWNFYFQQQVGNMSFYLPAPEQYSNIFGVAYWQWCNGLITNNIQGVASVAELGTNSFSGYYEISYFKSAYFNNVVSPANANLFSDVQLFTSTQKAGQNYENLFVTYNLTDSPGTNPT